MLDKIKKYISLRLGITETRNRLQYAENQLRFLTSFMSLTWPQNLELDSAILKSVLSDLGQNHQASKFNPVIHKNDVMFAYHVYHNADNLREAVLSYFRVGITTVHKLKKILDRYRLDPHRILDFGSGYGRVSRFFPQVFPHAEVVISEVKSQALDFQKENFHFEGINHSQDPETFSQGHFDLILAVSVFSHLPRKSFEAWMNTLINRLNTGGSLVFTFYNLSDSPHRHAPDVDFLYLKTSEDSNFAYVPDGIKNTSEYGVTYISHSFLEAFLSDKKVAYHFLNKELTKTQEALLIIKK